MYPPNLHALLLKGILFDVVTLCTFEKIKIVMPIDEQKRNLEEAVVSLFKISSQYMPEETESKTT
jgi:hypothetical protein